MRSPEAPRGLCPDRFGRSGHPAHEARGTAPDGASFGRSSGAASSNRGVLEVPRGDAKGKKQRGQPVGCPLCFLLGVPTGIRTPVPTVKG